MFSIDFATVIGINAITLALGRSFLTVEGGLENSMRVTEEVVFTLARGTPQERRCSLKATVVNTTTYCALLGMDFAAVVGGVIDTW